MIYSKSFCNGMLKVWERPRLSKHTWLPGSLLLISFLFFSLSSSSQQTDTSNHATQVLTLAQCIDYALEHQPAIKQSQINVSIARTNNAINLSGWAPQAGVGGSLIHYFQQPTAIITANGQTITEKTGVVNTVTIPAIAINQNIFTPSLLYSATAARLYVTQAKQVIDSTKIGIVSAVSKSFYSLLLTLQQIDVLKEDTVLFSRNVSDAYHQYVGGIVDATDYEEATISLNNAKAQLRQASENIVPEYAALKQLMGFSPQDQFNISYDTAQMMKDVAIDLGQQLRYEQRIEYQQLMTAKALQRKFITYNELSFLPSLGAYYDYNYEFENNSFSNLFNTAYPNSLIGLSLNLPILTGGSRIAGIHKAKLQEQLLNWSEVALKSEIYTEYTTALANYNGNLYNMQQLQQNVAMAKKVYGVVALQYRQGIVPYLNVITAESNLITSEIGYLNALSEVLSSKIDLQKAMGTLSY
jgi:outer membrane protein TolC